MSDYNLNLATLKAVALFSSNEETRYYLRGVCVEFVGANILAIATDGHTILTAKVGERDSGEDRASIIIPADALAKIKVNRRQGSDIELRHNTVAGTWALVYDGLVYGFTPIDGTFPDWRRVLPEHDAETYGKPAHFNPEYLHRFGKAAKLMGGSLVTPVVLHNGATNAAYVRMGNLDAFGVITPVRCGQNYADPFAPPTWAGCETPAKAAAE